MMGESPNFGSVDTRLNMYFSDTGLKPANGVVHTLTTSGAPIVIEVIGKNDSFFSCKSTEGEASLLGGQR